MFFTSRKKYLDDNTRELNITEDSKLLHLHRLCSDFGFAVIAFSGESATPKRYTLCEVGLTKDTSQSPKQVTPEFSSLVQLEEHAAENMVEIVQKYLFGDDDLSQESIAVA